MSSQVSHHCRDLGLNPSGSSGTLWRTRTSAYPICGVREVGYLHTCSHQSVWLRGLGVNLLSFVACPLLMLPAAHGSPWEESCSCWQVKFWKWMFPTGCRWSSNSIYYVSHLPSSISGTMLKMIEIHIWKYFPKSPSWILSQDLLLWGQLQLILASGLLPPHGMALLSCGSHPPWHPPLVPLLRPPPPACSKGVGMHRCLGRTC